ncbi:Hint domain-containing protein [Shimia sp. R10_1]|uniref:Hint domain-containing protein n=1 Tax=Shimia sp. R10_1 TaxID=2821095 RepID=UPI001FFE006C|nr:Hint domain-containing protein [Shimia sp. R10_1]
MPKLPINTGASALDMAQTIFGDDVTIESASYSGQGSSSGIYSDGDAISGGVTPSDTGVILSTGRASNFTNRFGAFNQRGNRSSDTNGEDNNPEFNAIAGASTFDAAYLDVSFTATEASQMTMQFVFASEEYPEFTNSVYQDFVAVSVNGTYVPLAIGDGDVDPRNINSGSNESLFVDNTGSTFNTEMDGFTQTMTLKFNITPGLNTIRIVIADVSDSSYDSSLLIAADSLQTSLIANADTVNLPIDGTRTVDVLANDVNNTGNSLTITHISGQPVSAGSTITLPSGQKILVNADGTLTLEGDGEEEQVNFSYTVDDGNGTTDVGFVTVNQAPCFTAGTFIRTPQGDVPVECLKVGDAVETLDNGAQPIRWIGRREVLAEGNLAPIHIAANTFGKHRSLKLSPLHRVLMQNAWAELLFGEEQVLVAARDLVNDHSVRRVPGGTVEYVHILFDEHQIVFSENLPTESFLPGPQTASSFEAEIVDEICTIFPEIDRESGEGYGPMARRGLRSYEAAAMAHLAAE